MMVVGPVITDRLGESGNLCDRIACHTSDMTSDFYCTLPGKGCRQTPPSDDAPSTSHWARSSP